MTAKIRHHIMPHTHEDGSFHRAHAILLPALFAYLQILIVITVGVYAIRLNVPRILGTVTFSSQQIIDLTNTKREENGLPKLTSNPMLAQAAAEKAQDMFAYDYWAHYSPTGKTPWSFINATGYKYIYAGENLARDFNDPKSVVDAWMNSPSHRSNLLDRNFREIGVAVADGKLNGHDGILVVQMFGTQPAGAVVDNSQVAFGETNTQLAPENAEVLASKQFSLARGLSLGLVGFIFVMFAMEAIVTLKRSNLRLSGSVVAHMAILAFVLVAVWYSATGAII